MPGHEGQGPEVPLYESRELPKRPPRHKTPTWGNARLGGKGDIAARHHFGQQERLHISGTPLVETQDDGSKLSALPYRGIELSGEDLNRHLLCIAQTGDGKTLWFAEELVSRKATIREFYRACSP